MKKNGFILILPAAIYVALAVCNLLIPLRPALSFAEIATDTPEAEAAKQIIGEKCIMCHSKDPNLPFYARLPLAGGFIEKHVKKGTGMMNLYDELSGTSTDRWALDRLRHVIENDTMPIDSYLLLHWDGKLSGREQAAILAWIDQRKAMIP